MNVVIVGRGRVGRALEKGLRHHKQVHAHVQGRRPDKQALRAASLVVLAVPDDEIASACKAVAPHLSPKAAVVHCAGARGVEELVACAATNAVGVMHPLASCPSATRPPDLSGTTFLVYGDRLAIERSARVARALHGYVVKRSVSGPAYHAAAALVANGAAALAHAGSGILQRIGFKKKEADRALGGLLRTVADNVEHIGTPAALTGPVARGDDETVRAHRRALKRVGSTSRAAYDHATAIVLTCAKAAGLDKSQAAKVRRALKER